MRQSLLSTVLVCSALVSPAAFRENNMIGTWTGPGASACPQGVVFQEDDGKRVSGDCDNDKYTHHYDGTYTSPTTIQTTIVRKDLSTGCEVVAGGYIRFLNPDKIKLGQNGFHGCGVSVGAASSILTRH